MNKNEKIYLEIYEKIKELDDLNICEYLVLSLKTRIKEIQEQEAEELDKKKSAAARSMRGG